MMMAKTGVSLLMRLRKSKDRNCPNIETPSIKGKVPKPNKAINKAPWYASFVATEPTNPI